MNGWEMSSGAILLTNFGAVLLLQTIVWITSVRLRNAGLADVCWGTGFVVVAWLSVALAGSWTLRGTVLASMATLWGLRLSAYLAWRNLGKGEDYRYRAMREQRPDTFWLTSLLTVFWLQGGLMWIVALPLQWKPGLQVSSGVVPALGLVIWSCGWLCESIGDWQLARFKSRPENKGRVMQDGLWRYTRHPNYFGDFLVWWGIYLVAIGTDPAWWLVVSPLLMSFLLLRVSGVALLERTIGERRPEYQDYAQRTSSFIPWPPKRGRRG